jgi:hypothetical protein
MNVPAVQFPMVQFWLLMTAERDPNEQLRHVLSTVRDPFVRTCWSRGQSIHRVQRCTFCWFDQRPIEQFAQIRFATELPFVLICSPSSQVVHAVQFWVFTAVV